MVDRSEDEERRIKDVLNNLSQALYKQRASYLLHSMATATDILFWTLRGQLLRDKRIIPVTNIAELVEYVLLPHNHDVTKRCALNTFLHGLEEFLSTNLVPRALFPGFGGGAGKGPGIGRPIRHFYWLIDLGNSCKKMAK